LEGRSTRTLASIDEVHVDGPLPTARIRGFFDEPEVCGYYNLKAREIGLNLNRDDHELSVAHEIGHLVAIEGIGGGRAVCGNSLEFGPWRTAIQASNAFKRLLRIRSAGVVAVRSGSLAIDYPLDAADFEHLNYLLNWEELWARSYCQFIAVKSDNAAMFRQIRREEASDYGLIFSPQWGETDFDAIKSTIEGVLKGRGWMP
jgi:hypothetical protein